MKITNYQVKAPLSAPLRVAQVADLHNGAYDEILTALEDFCPDIVAVTGDFLDRRERVARGFSFLSESAKRGKRSSLSATTK